jgi:hypothetical protein
VVRQVRASAPSTNKSALSAARSCRAATFGRQAGFNVIGTCTTELVDVDGKLIGIGKGQRHRSTAELSKGRQRLIREGTRFISSSGGEELGRG